MSDKYIASNVLLAGFNGANNATMYSEESSGRVATFSGNAKLTTSGMKWGSACLALDGSGDFVTFPDNAAWTLGTADFTLEAWFYLTAFPGAGLNATICAHYNATGNDRGFQQVVNENGSVILGYSTNGTNITAIAQSPDATVATARWNHNAFVRTGGVVYNYVNGILVASESIGTASIFNSTAALSIGAVLTGGGANYLNGFIDDVRITPVARYLSNFGRLQGPYSRAKRTGTAGTSRMPSVNIYRAA